MHLHKPYFWHRFGFHFFAQEVLTPECVAAGCSNYATHPPYCEQHNDGIFGIRITSCMDRPEQQQVVATRQLPAGHLLPYLGEVLSDAEVLVRYGSGFATYCAPAADTGFWTDAAMYRCPASVVDHAPRTQSNMEWHMHSSYSKSLNISAGDLQRINRELDVEWRKCSMRCRRTIEADEVLLCCYREAEAASSNRSSSNSCRQGSIRARAAADVMSSEQPHGFSRTVWQ
jgi:hypothetical protein